MIPASSRYVVVGAGMHGLSTAYHLAVELRQREQGSGADVVVLEKSTPGAGATGIACGVVRNNYFQPAMSELMQACVEVWESDPEAYHYNGVGYIALGPQRAGERSRGRVRAPPANRLPLRAHPGRGRGRRAHEGALPGLARAGRHRLPARAPGRLRLQHRVGPRPARQVPLGGRADPLPHRGDGLRARRRRHRHGGRDRSGPDRRRRAGRRRPRPLGQALLGDARPARRRSTSTRRRATSCATSRCGRTGTSRRARSRSTR